MKETDKPAFPKWLRVALILVALLYLLIIMFGKQAPQRQDFPFFRRF